MHTKKTKNIKRKKRGCPTCGGIDSKTCMRCKGKTKLCDWQLVYPKPTAPKDKQG